LTSLKRQKVSASSFEKRGKLFFFEKKNQKTFASHAARWQPRVLP